VTRAEWWSRWVRPKGHLPPRALAFVAAIACLPLLIAVARSLALPGDGSQPLVLEPLRALGAFVNQHLTFDWVPPSDRPTILYLLLLPTGALLVAVFRLVFGIRVLGLRAILMAIGFRAIGFLSGLSLILVIVGAVALVRPWIRRIHMPNFARITFVVCLSAMIMLGAVLVAPWLGSEVVWRMAFFPAIILAMFAEGVAKSMEQDDLFMALWRAAWTIGLALVFTVIDGPVSQLTYQFPELILTQLMAIVLVAEFLDLRLLEAWPARLSRRFARAGHRHTGQPKVAVVRNSDTAGAGRIAPLGRPAPKGYAERPVQPYVDALREQGFAVKVFEGDMMLLRELARYLPPDPRRGTPGGIVFNLATGVQGEARFVHVPAMLELAGIPYTGPGPVAHACQVDRFALLTLLRQADVPVPRHHLIGDPSHMIAVKFPALVRPRVEPDASRRVVRNRRSLRHAVRSIRNNYGQAAVVETPVRGRRISVALLGNHGLECLPLVEHLPAGGGGGKACPAQLDEAIVNRIRAVAHTAFFAAGCRDYARVDIRLSRADEPVVVDVKSVDVFARQGAFLTAAEVAGYGFGDVMRRIVTEAARRYLASPYQPRESVDVGAVVSLAERRAATG
jgi:D-alanine-D-alanine ligase